MKPTMDHLHGSSRSTLAIADLDAGFRIQIQTLLRLALPAMYADVASHIDVAAMRKRGQISVISYIELAAAAVPLAVAGTIEIDRETRLCELSGVTPGHARARLGIEVRFGFRSQPGTGDPQRYRETVAGAEPVSCGSGRMLLALLRPAAPLAERLVSEVPEEMAHLTAHRLEPPHPAAEDLTRVSEGVESSEIDVAGVWGLHHSDINQYVFTGAYISVLEDVVAQQVHAAGLPAGRHRVHRVSALFRKPFAAGDGFRVQGKLRVHGNDTVLVAGIHALDAEGGAFQHPAVIGRLEGQVTTQP
jgi:hypothetical protein